VKSSESYRRYLRDLNAFAEALHALLQVMELGGGSEFLGNPGQWTPRAGQEAEAARRKAAVDLVAGRAAYAFHAAGSFVDWQPRGTFQRQPVNPATGWATILDWDPAFDADIIFACARQAVGILEMKAEEAEDSERQRVRRAAGSLARLTGSGLAPLARWTVRAAGSLILVVAGAGLTYWLGWH